MGSYNSGFFQIFFIQIESFFIFSSSLPASFFVSVLAMPFYPHGKENMHEGFLASVHVMFLLILYSFVQLLIFPQSSTQRIFLFRLVSSFFVVTLRFLTTII